MDEMTMTVSKISKSGLFTNLRLLYISSGIIAYYSQVPPHFVGNVRSLQLSGILPKQTISSTDLLSAELHQDCLTFTFHKSKLLDRATMHMLLNKNQFTNEGKNDSEIEKWEFKCQVKKGERFLEMVNRYRGGGKIEVKSCVEGFKKKSIDINSKKKINSNNYGNNFVKDNKNNREKVMFTPARKVNSGEMEEIFKKMMEGGKEEIQSFEIKNTSEIEEIITSQTNKKQMIQLKQQNKEEKIIEQKQNQKQLQNKTQELDIKNQKISSLISMEEIISSSKLSQNISPTENRITFSKQGGLNFQSLIQQKLQYSAYNNASLTPQKCPILQQSPTSKQQPPLIIPLISITRQSIPPQFSSNTTPQNISQYSNPSYSSLHSLQFSSIPEYHKFSVSQSSYKGSISPLIINQLRLLKKEITTIAPILQFTFQQMKNNKCSQWIHKSYAIRIEKYKTAIIQRHRRLFDEGKQIVRVHNSRNKHKIRLIPTVFIQYKQYYGVVRQHIQNATPIENSQYHISKDNTLTWKEEQLQSNSYNAIQSHCISLIDSYEEINESAIRQMMPNITSVYHNYGLSILFSLTNCMFSNNTLLFPKSVSYHNTTLLPLIAERLSYASAPEYQEYKHYLSLYQHLTKQRLDIICSDLDSLQNTPQYHPGLFHVYKSVLSTVAACPPLFKMVMENCNLYLSRMYGTHSSQRLQLALIEGQMCSRGWQYHFEWMKRADPQTKGEFRWKMNQLLYEMKEYSKIMQYNVQIIRNNDERYHYENAFILGGAWIAVYGSNSPHYITDNSFKDFCFQKEPQQQLLLKQLIRLISQKKPTFQEAGIVLELCRLDKQQAKQNGKKIGVYMIFERYNDVYAELIAREEDRQLIQTIKKRIAVR